VVLGNNRIEEILFLGLIQGSKTHLDHWVCREQGALKALAWDPTTQFES
jgi:hypothetical protein